MPFTLLPENGFTKAVQTTVLPGLKPFHQSGAEETAAGVPVRWDWYGCEKPRGSILISHGFTESGFKMIEMAWYFHQMGFNVMTFDHLGHGYSRKEGADVSLTDVKAFSDYLEAVGKVDRVMRGKGDGPYFLYAHSMGGAVGALYVKAHPDAFRGAVFTSPMIRAQTAGLPIWAAGGIAQAACLLGLGGKMVFIHKIYDPEESFEASPATSRARFRWYSAVRQKYPRYRNNGASYRWLREAMKACGELTGKKGAEGIRIPTVFYIAEKDDIVDTGAIRTFASKIPHARLVQIPHSKHEIYRSGNRAMGIYLRSIESFFDEQCESGKE